MKPNVPEDLKWLVTVVVEAYRSGKPVVLIAKDGGVLHGEDTLRSIIDTGAELEVLTIKNIDRQQFEACELPEICEAAREAWLKDAFPPEQ